MMFDSLHSIVDALGKWRDHPGLSVTTYNRLGTGGPHIALALLPQHATVQEQTAFLADLARILQVDAHPCGQMASLHCSDYQGTGIAIGVIGRVQDAQVVAA